MITSDKAECSLNMGEIVVFDGLGVITCFGLGSCVALFLYSRVHKVGGGAHIMLPKFGGREKETEISVFNYADQAIAALVQQMGIKSGNTGNLGLRAKLVGGAHLFEGDHLQIGEKNIAAVMEQLLQRKIYVAGMDVGGKISRTARFYTDDGMVEVSTPSYKHII